MISREPHPFVIDQVYGIEWEKRRDTYSPYQHWMDTDAQLLEMVIFDGIKGMKRCSITD